VTCSRRPGEDADQRKAARAATFRQLSTGLRYQARLGRTEAALRVGLDALRQRRLGAQTVMRDEPKPTPPANDAMVPDEPGRPLNRHQRRVPAAIARKRAA
jgi:hypothetical protein